MSVEEHGPPLTTWNRETSWYSRLSYIQPPTKHILHPLQLKVKLAAIKDTLDIVIYVKVTFAAIRQISIIIFSKKVRSSAFPTQIISPTNFFIKSFQICGSIHFTFVRHFFMNSYIKEHRITLLCIQLQQLINSQQRILEICLENSSNFYTLATVLLAVV